MPDDLALYSVSDAADAVADAEALLSDAVHDARQAGHSLRAIAKAAQRSHQTIANMLAD